MTTFKILNQFKVQVNSNLALTGVSYPCYQLLDVIYQSAMNKSLFQVLRQRTTMTHCVVVTLLEFLFSSLNLRKLG